jgi:D-amino peptidase
MRVFISVDMEGISGLVRWQDVVTSGIDFARARRFMTADTNAAIAGAFDGGAREVIVEENHGVEDLCNLLMDEIDPRCRVIRGAGRPHSTTMAGLDAGIGVVLLVGHHARAGSRPGIMAHTVSYGEFRLVRLNGRPVGEPDLFAIRAGEFGVPVGFVSGDQVVAEQVRAIAPGAQLVTVKQALSNVAGDCIPPARAVGLIREGAARAVMAALRGELAPYTGEPAPYQIEVVLKEPAHPALRDNLARLPEFELCDDHTVRTTAPDMDIGFRRIAYLGYGKRPGVIRY